MFYHWLFEGLFIYLFLHEVHEMSTKQGHHIHLSDCMSHHQSFPSGILNLVLWFYIKILSEFHFHMYESGTNPTLYEV
jgi:hypothetical protein